jgi:hypothetical protein
MTFPLASLLRQYMSCVGMPPLDFSSCGEAYSFSRTFVCFQFRHKFFLQLLVNYRLLIALHQSAPVTLACESAVGNLLIRGARLLDLRSALMSLRSKNDKHLVPFHPRTRLYFTYVGKVLF